MSKILIVEDDVAFCTMLKTFLKKNDYEVSTAFSGSQAVLQIQNDTFDVVLTDVRLPDKDGIALLSDILNKNNDTQVIIMTGYAEINMAVNAIKQGAFDYVSKPFNPDAILQVIKKALESGESKEEITQKPKKNTIDVSRKTPSSFVRGVSDASKKLQAQDIIKYLDEFGANPLGEISPKKKEEFLEP